MKLIVKFLIGLLRSLTSEECAWASGSSFCRATAGAFFIRSLCC